MSHIYCPRNFSNVLITRLISYSSSLPFNNAFLIAVQYSKKSIFLEFLPKPPGLDLRNEKRDATVSFLVSNLSIKCLKNISIEKCAIFRQAPVYFCLLMPYTIHASVRPDSFFIKITMISPLDTTHFHILNHNLF